MTTVSHGFTTTSLEAVRNEIILFLRTRATAIVRSSALAVQNKDSDVAGDVVTNVDYALQSALMDFLPSLVEGSKFVGEENFAGIPEAHEGPLWIVDPLDGTLNFAVALPLYGISICLVVEKQPCLAVVFDLVNNVIYDAVSGKGARANSARLRWDEQRAAIAPSAITSGFVSRHLVHGDAGDVGNLVSLLGPKYRIFGSQAVQLCWAAAGQLKLNISAETKLWDEAAGLLICCEAGAAHRTLSDESVFPLRTDGAAAAGKSLLTVAGSPDLVQRIASVLEGVSRR